MDLIQTLLCQARQSVVHLACPRDVAKIITLTKNTFVNGSCVAIAVTGEINTTVKSDETRQLRTTLVRQQNNECCLEYHYLNKNTFQTNELIQEKWQRLSNHHCDKKQTF